MKNENPELSELIVQHELVMRENQKLKEEVARLKELVKILMENKDAS